MTVGQYTITSGIASPSEQDTLDRLDEFMTGALGWSRLDVIADSSTDNDRVWFNRGENASKYKPMYVRAQATGDEIYFYGYTYWDPVGSTGSDEISDSVELRVQNDNSGGADDYVFVGNKDAVFVSIRRESTGANILGGFGYWDTFYNSSSDPLPLWVMGGNTNNDNFETTDRVQSYAFDPDGFLNVVSTYSGGATPYIAQDRSFLAAVSAPQTRDNRHLMIKQDFYTERSRTNGDIPGSIAHENRGEIPGIYQIYGINFAPNDRLVASGVDAGGINGNELGTGDFVISKGSNGNCYALGPLQDWNPTPKSKTGLELWLKGDAVQRRGGDDIGGRVKEWIDLSEEKNPASQTTNNAQPVPVGGVLNSESVVRFDNDVEDRFLEGTLTLPNDVTIFAVSSYRNSSQTGHLFHWRGDNSGTDVSLELFFNGDAGSDNVVFTARTDTGNEDSYKFNNLNPNTFYILSAVVSGTNTEFRFNGSSADAIQLSDTKGSFAGTLNLNYFLGGDSAAGGAFNTGDHQGDSAEIIVYNRNMTNEEVESIECYLSDKYNITVSGTCP